MKQKKIEFNQESQEFFAFFISNLNKELFAVPIARKDDFIRVHKVNYAGGKEVCFANGCNRWIKSSEPIRSVDVFDELKVANYTNNRGKKAELIMFLD